MSASIVSFGLDRTLVDTRQLIFQSAGYTSRAVHSFEELERCLRESPIDVLVLCHSVPAEQCEAAKQLAHHQANKVLVLVITKGRHICGPEGVDDSFDCSLGPERLLRTMTHLLQEHGQERSHPRVCATPA